MAITFMSAWYVSGLQYKKREVTLSLTASVSKRTQLRTERPQLCKTQIRIMARSTAIILISALLMLCVSSAVAARLYSADTKQIKKSHRLSIVPSLAKNTVAHMNSKSSRSSQIDNRTARKTAGNGKIRSVSRKENLRTGTQHTVARHNRKIEISGQNGPAVKARHADADEHHHRTLFSRSGARLTRAVHKYRVRKDLHITYTVRFPRSCSCMTAKGMKSGICYYYTNPRTRQCKKRKCIPNYICVQGFKTGITCVRRKSKSRVIPVGNGRCQTKKTSKYAYVPYSIYWTVSANGEAEHSVLGV